jgi:hypothetical protein
LWKHFCWVLSQCMRWERTLGSLSNPSRWFSEPNPCDDVAIYLLWASRLCVSSSADRSKNAIMLSLLKTKLCTAQQP